VSGATLRQLVVPPSTAVSCLGTPSRACSTPIDPNIYLNTSRGGSPREMDWAMVQSGMM
jgi:hypothetical protein